MLRKIININCLMTFLVVGIHASCRIQLTGEYDSWVSMLNRYVNVLCDMAVPTFFSISAYLFFLKFQIGDYFKKLRSRIKSLIIPYFIFSALGLLLINAKLFVKGEQLRVNNISDILNSLLWADFNPPIWYLLTLFSFAVISPILYFALSGKFARCSVIILSIISYIINVSCEVPYSNLFFWFPVIIPFSYFGINHKNIFSDTIIKDRGIRCFVLLFTLFFPFFFITSSEYSSSYYTYRILAPFLILLCSDFFDFKSFDWAKFTFLVYLSHSLVLLMLEHFPVSNFGEGLLKWCVVFLICLLLSGGTKRFFPKIYCILNGGR